MRSAPRVRDLQKIMPPSEKMSPIFRSSVIASISSWPGRGVWRLADSRTIGNVCPSPTVLRKTCSWLKHQRTARSISGSFESGSYQVSAVWALPDHGRRANDFMVCTATPPSVHFDRSPRNSCCSPRFSRAGNSRAEGPRRRGIVPGS